MNLTDKSFINEIAAWAETNTDKEVFPEICEDIPSYYRNRESEDTYMMEYSVETMEELKELLEKHGGLSEDPLILQMIVHATCQNRYRKGLEISEIKSGQNLTNTDKVQLPDFIYVF